MVLVAATTFIRKRQHRISNKSLLLLFGIAVLVFIAGSALYLRVGSRLQAAIAEPYIQQALDQKCGQGVIIASEGETYNESFYHWRANTSSATCYYDNKEWLCSCSAK